MTMCKKQQDLFRSKQDQTMTAETQVFKNLSSSELVEQALANGEGQLTDTGALLITTGKRTGRSPADRFVVKEPSSQDSIDWGSVNPQ
jgi:phosphoenolpyruvate carboxykinase (ATP)